ncbi:MAG: hypothetical protein HZA93_08820 [Verrucomicrobia bacterium]|nr:hypothetical protein [Verrucomicrobiota bacterium]
MNTSQSIHAVSDYLPGFEYLQTLGGDISGNGAVVTPSPQPSTRLKVGAIPYVRYRDEDFDVQLDLSELDRRVLRKIHLLDRGDARGCYASNVTLADYLSLTVGQVRGVIQRLKKRGYLVTMGFSDLGSVAYRRVKLKYERIPGVRGVGNFEVQAGQRMKRRYRKAGEPNPSIRLITDTQVQAPNADNGDVQFVQPPAPLEMHLTKINSDNQSPLPPCEQGGVNSSLVKTGKKGKDWVSLLSTYPEAEKILACFKITDVTPAIARSLVRRFEKGAVTPRGLLYVTGWSNYLPEDINHPARAAHTLEDFLRRYAVIRDYVLDRRREILLVDLQCAAQGMHTIYTTPEDDSAYAIEELQRSPTATFDTFAESGVNIRALCFAAYYFKVRGEAVENSPYSSRVTKAAVMNPAVFEFMRQRYKFDLAPVAWITEAEAIALRADIVADIQQCKQLVAMFPTLEVLEDFDALLKDYDFCSARVDEFYDTGEIRRFATAYDARVSSERPEPATPGTGSPAQANDESVPPNQ